MHERHQRMSVLAWLLVGGAIGGLARWALRAGHRTADYVVVATLGALIGGFGGAVAFRLDVTGLNPFAIFLATLGALALVAVLCSILPLDADN